MKALVLDLSSASPRLLASGEIESDLAGFAFAEDLERQRNGGEQTNEEERPTDGLPLWGVQPLPQQEGRAGAESRASPRQQRNFGQS